LIIEIPVCKGKSWHWHALSSNVHLHEKPKKNRFKGLNRRRAIFTSMPSNVAQEPSEACLQGSRIAFLGPNLEARSCARETAILRKPRNMASSVSRTLWTIGLVAAAALPVRAEGPTFADLLARAESQAAAGHRWSPPGDNMTETVAGMMDLIPSATTEQLSQLSALLEKDALRSPSQQPNAEASQNVQTATAPSTIVLPAVPRAAPAPPPMEMVAPPSVPPATKGPSQITRRPTPRAMELFARGQQAESHGDVSAARRFFASAAAQGHAAAARALGRLYDPAYLKQTAMGGIDPDPALARQWYEQAVAMGDVEAGPLLEALSMR
jgi:hypothetical protein